MRATRALLVVAGLACVLVGAWHLRDASVAQLLSAALWLAGGVLVHDALLAPLTVGVVVLGARLSPRRARGALLVGLVVWGTITVAVLNVLLGVGGKPDNPTLLDRPYLTWWLVLSLVWWAAIAVVALVRVRRGGPVQAARQGT